jgi:hypothetical protein
VNRLLEGAAPAYRVACWVTWVPWGLLGLFGAPLCVAAGLTCVQLLALFVVVFLGQTGRAYKE